MSYLENDAWVTLSGTPIKCINEHITKYFKEGKYSFHVGSDSKTYTESTTVITTICFREPSHGAIVAYQKTHVPNFSNITLKLLHEAQIAIEAAQIVKEIIGDCPTVHADVNPDKNALSNRSINVIKGIVEGMGFPILVKPNAWAADIADMFTR